MIQREICSNFDAIVYIPHKVTRLVATAMLALNDEGWQIIANPPDIINKVGRYSPDLIATRVQEHPNQIDTILVEATNSAYPTEKHLNKARQMRVVSAEMKINQHAVGFIFSGVQHEAEPRLQALLLNLSQGNITRHDFIQQLKIINPQAGNWDRFI